MSNWSAAANNLTVVAVADTIAYTNAGFVALQGGSTTQSLLIKEVYIGGLGTGSSASGMQMTFGRDSTVGAATLSGGTLAALDPATAALAAPPVQFTASTSTKPQRSATLGYLLTPAFSGNGGIVRWVAVPYGEIMLLGNTASFGELSLSCVGGTITAVSTHLVFEPK